MSSRLSERLQSFAPVPIRLALGFGLLYHGYPKLFTVGGNTDFVGMLQGIGVPLPDFAAYAIGGFEFFGGILLMLGVAVRVVSAIGAVEMLFAALLVHLPAGFNFIHVIGTTADGAPQFGLPGYEVNVLYCAGFLSLILLGAGRVSLPSVRSDQGVAEERRELTRAG